MTETSPILTLEDVQTHFPVTEGFLQRERGRVRAVDGVSFELERGEILGLVGESGSGKSTVARTIMGLETPTSGTIQFDGTDVASMDRESERTFRRRVQMVFQDTASSFDPRMTIGDAIREPMEAHGLTDEDVLESRVGTLLEEVGLSAAFDERYPHQLSGGEKQRAALARALSLDPDVLVLDEPVSALDVSVQAQIIELILRLQTEFDLSIILITHDMAVVREVCTRVAVMYLGEIVELAPTERLFESPEHPYTRSLVEVIPEPDPARATPEIELHGSIPDPIDPPPGCRFHTRCPEVIPPDELEVSQSAYRGIMDLKVAIRDGTFSLASIVDRDGSGRIQSGAGSGSVTQRVRDHYDIPATLQDQQAEVDIEKVLTGIVDGNIEDAQTLLSERFSSICEQESPTPTDRPDGRVCCHLHREGEREMEDLPVGTSTLE